jgi:hypothetical protein
MTESLLLAKITRYWSLALGLIDYVIFKFDTGSITRFFFNDTNFQYPISHLGISTTPIQSKDSPTALPNTKTHSTRPPNYQIINDNDENLHFSCPSEDSEGFEFVFAASLDNVKKVCVYSNQTLKERADICSGLLFMYSDGTREALGCCGVGLYDMVEFLDPIAIHWRNNSDELGIRINVGFSTKMKGFYAPPEEGWQTK